MEEYTPSSDEVEDTPLQRRRFLSGNFLRSWLEHRSDDDEDDEEETDKKKDKKSKSSEKEDWRPERLRDRLKNIFRGMVGLELVSASAAEVETADAKVTSKTEKSEPVIPTLPIETISQQQSVIENEGVLAVSPDAQRRYYGYEAPAEVVNSAAEEVQEVEVDDIETNDQPLERYLTEPETQPVSSSAEQQNATTAESGGEVRRRQQADKLEKQVKRLKNQTKSIKREQQEVVEQQNKFANKLEAQQKAQERFNKVTVPKMEKDRQRLQSRLEQPAKAVTSEKPPFIARPEAPVAKPIELKTEGRTLPSSEVKVEARQMPKAPEVLDKPEPKAKLEQLAQTIEQATGQNTLVESQYERRHEVKDAADAPNQAVSSGSGGGPVGGSQTSFRPRPQFSQPTPNILPPVVSPSQPPAHQPQQPDRNLYKQAAQTGFWTAIVIIVAVILVLMITRR